MLQSSNLLVYIYDDAKDNEILKTIKIKFLPEIFKLEIFLKLN